MTIAAPKSPPIAPDIVFLGEILGQSLGPLTVEPTQYAILSQNTGINTAKTIANIAQYFIDMTYALASIINGYTIANIVDSKSFRGLSVENANIPIARAAEKRNEINNPTSPIPQNRSIR